MTDTEKMILASNSVILSTLAIMNSNNKELEHELLEISNEIIKRLEEVKE